IVVDEEHDSSYKQEESLRYNGRDVAVVRGKFLACPVILGSATPAVESYENCLQGRYRLLEITKRVYERPLPRIETVDLRSEFNRPTSIANIKSTELRTDSSPSHTKAANTQLSHRKPHELRDNNRKSLQCVICLKRRAYYT